MLEMQSPYEALMLKAAQDESFRDALLKNPKATLEAHLGTQLPEGFTINVVENTATELTLVIPPKLSGELSDEALSAVAGGAAKRPVLFSVMTLGLGCLISAATETVDACAERSEKGYASRTGPMGL
ncbi:hypothetical protein D3C86_525730 [compost metagenome]